MLKLDTVSPPRLTEYNRAIAQYVRLSGTPDEARAAAYVEGKLREFGYAAHAVTHDAYISLPGPARLHLTHPEAREIPAITHSMARPTGPGGVAGALIFVGKGGVALDYVRAGAAGKIALVDDMATPEQAVAGTQAGVAGLIFISGRHAHEMCISPVWGSPAASTVGMLPGIPMVSVRRADGEALRETAARGRAAVAFTAAVETRWTRTPIVLGDLGPGHPEAESDLFVLFSGHLDGWHLGAMDNGSANATMLEVARVLAGRRGEWRRGLRVAFWSGHSHGRYSSSAWYADHHWFDLADHCVVHVNIDSVGAMDADRFGSNAMPETAELGTWAVREAAGAEFAPKRVGRDSDQSFLGIGIPSLFGSLSHQADGSLGWWWHTPHDTLDKIDPERLGRDARVFALTIDRLLADAVLPLDYGAAAADLRQTLERLDAEAGPSFDLAGAAADAARLEELCGRLRRTGAGASGARARAVNACLRRLSRTLIPATYTVAGRYTHDAALDNEFLPRLAPARRLAALPPEGDEARFLRVDLVRGRTAVMDAVRTACRLVEACLDDVD